LPKSPTSSFFFVSTLITGLASRLERAGRLVEIAELGIPVGMLSTLDRFGIALQAETLSTQQIGHRVRADAMPLAGQLGGQPPGRLDRPPQRRHRITTLIRFDQRQQRHPQLRVGIGEAFTARTDPPHPTLQRRVAGQVPHVTRHRRLGHPCTRFARLVDGPGPAGQPGARHATSGGPRRAHRAAPVLPSAAATTLDVAPTEPVAFDANLDPHGSLRQSLAEIVRDHGSGALDDPKLLATLLPDLLPRSPRGTRLIRAAAETGVGRLLADRLSNGLSATTAVRDVSVILARDFLLDAAPSEWIVAEYATTLGYRGRPLLSLSAPR
jgi:hypothetical protein